MEMEEVLPADDTTMTARAPFWTIEHKVAAEANLLPNGGSGGG